MADPDGDDCDDDGEEAIGEDAEGGGGEFTVGGGGSRLEGRCHDEFLHVAPWCGFGFAFGEWVKRKVVLNCGFADHGKVNFDFIPARLGSTSYYFIWEQIIWKMT